MATRKQRIPATLKNLVVMDRTPEEQRAAEAEDREARRRGRYYKGVARRIRHGIISPEEIAMLREDKARVTAIREGV